MDIVKLKAERTFVCKLGELKVCDTIHQLVDDDGNVMMQETVRTEFAAEWLNETMANELWEWKKSGFSGPAPIWV